MKEVEQWRDIAGYEGYYRVSNLGNIYSIKRKKFLKPFPSRDHFVVSLHRETVQCTKRVHHLVLEAFVGPRPEGMECRHFPDRNTANNRLDNLVWGTRSENCADRNLQGTSQRGEGNHLSKLKEKEVLMIKNLVAGGNSYRKVATQFSISQSMVSRIICGNRWSHL